MSNELELPVHWEVLWDTQEPWDDEPVFSGTYEECLAFSRRNPNMRLIWAEPQWEEMPSLSIH